MDRELYFETVFEIRNLEQSLCRFIPGLKDSMMNELIQTHNTYANLVNSDEGYDKLNKIWDELHPNYFEENKGKHWTELTEYNEFLRKECTSKFVNKINEQMSNNIMTYRIGDEAQLIGALKMDPKVEIEFWLKEVK